MSCDVFMVLLLFDYPCKSPFADNQIAVTLAQYRYLLKN